MPSPTDTNFQAPSAAQVKDLLDRHPVTRPSKITALLPIIALAVVLLLALSVNQGPALLLPWLALLGLFIFSTLRVARQREMESRGGSVQELTMTRHYVRALRKAWRLLPGVTAMPELHGRTVAMIGHCLGEVGAHESAIVAFDYLIDRLPAENPASRQLCVQRAIAQIASDHMVDADDSLRRLRDLANDPSPGVARAGFIFATLYRDIRTYHDSEAVALADNLVNDLRPMGVEAGYGYALMAVAMLRTAQRQPEQAPHWTEQAIHWWSRATLLLPADDIFSKYPETSQIKADPQIMAGTRSCVPPRR